MANKFARKNFLDTVQTDVNQLDFLSFKWLDFKQSIKNKNVDYFRITDEFVGRLDLVAHDFYGNVFLWWILALVNDVLDPINDISVGKVLIIPSIVDIENYYQTILNKRRKNNKVSLPIIKV